MIRSRGKLNFFSTINLQIAPQTNQDNITKYHLIFKNPQMETAIIAIGPPTKDTIKDNVLCPSGTNPKEALCILLLTVVDLELITPESSPKKNIKLNMKSI